eukprot:1565882-Pyramimonas_sp.AAC.2
MKNTLPRWTAGVWAAVQHASSMGGGWGRGHFSDSRDCGRGNGPLRWPRGPPMRGARLRRMRPNFHAVDPWRWRRRACSECTCSYHP